MPAPRKLADAATRSLAGLLVRVFFRSVEVSGTENLPATGAVIEVANHRNGLVDGLVLIAVAARYPRFLAKSTLWHIFPLRPFLALAGAVPVYRGADAAAATGSSETERAAGNAAALARATELLGAGGTVGVFPEGISHDLASLQDLRTGAARLALDAAAEGSTEVRIAPVGIFYDDKSRFRSRVYVRFAPALDVDDLVPAYRDDPRAAVRRLTAQIAAEMRAVGPEFESVTVAARCSRAATLAATSLGDQEGIARRLAGAVDDPRWQLLLRDLAAYDAGLASLGVSDADLVAVAGGDPDGRRAGDQAATVLTLPAAVAGVAAHAFPYLLMRGVGRVPRNQGMRSTVKLLGSFGLYTLCYAAVGVLVGRRRGPLAGTIAAAALPLCGWAALVRMEETQELGGLRRASMAFRRRRRAVTALLEARAGLVSEVRSLSGADPLTMRSRSQR